MQTLNTPNYAGTEFSLYYQKYSAKACFESTDEHFDCLDSFRSVYEPNIEGCKSTYRAWCHACDPAVRRMQMDSRASEHRNRLLFTEETLRQYNKDKNRNTYLNPTLLPTK